MTIKVLNIDGIGKSQTLKLPENLESINVEIPPSHFDYDISTNVALILAKPNQIKIYGHRGARGDLPENTLDSFKFLFENEINIIQPDQRLQEMLLPMINNIVREEMERFEEEELQQAIYRSMEET